MTNQQQIEVKQVLIANNLAHLIPHLSDEKYIKSQLKEYFTKLEGEDKPIPQELDWIYSCYHEVNVVHMPLRNQCN